MCKRALVFVGKAKDLKGGILAQRRQVISELKEVYSEVLGDWSAKMVLDEYNAIVDERYRRTMDDVTLNNLTEMTKALTKSYSAKLYNMSINDLLIEATRFLPDYRENLHHMLIEEYTKKCEAMTDDELFAEFDKLLNM